MALFPVVSFQNKTIKVEVEYDPSTLAILSIVYTNPTSKMQSIELKDSREKTLETRLTKDNSLSVDVTKKRMVMVKDQNGELSFPYAFNAEYPS